jgi:hypothetical protein
MQKKLTEGEDASTNDGHDPMDLSGGRPTVPTMQSRKFHFMLFLTNRMALTKLRWEQTKNRKTAQGFAFQVYQCHHSWTQAVTHLASQFVSFKLEKRDKTDILVNLIRKLRAKTCREEKTNTETKVCQTANARFEAISSSKEF